jgi:predicted ferric reductase
MTSRDASHRLPEARSGEPGQARESAADQPFHIGDLRQYVGGSVIVGVVVANALLWLALRPSGQPTSRYLGEILGTTAILLLSCGLVLATRLHVLERYFGGLDRMYPWHRWCAIVAVALLLPHQALASAVTDPIHSGLGDTLGILALLGLLVLLVWAVAPRVPVLARHMRSTYQQWFTVHRLTGLVVAGGLAHAALVDPVLRRSTVLLVWFVVVGSIGVLAYLYRELLARYVAPRYNYTVETVDRLDRDTLAVALEPLAEPVPFVAGQFVFVLFGGVSSWDRHPFTVSSAPREPRLRLSIKALGDYTQHLYDTLQPSTSALVSGAFGGFDYSRGEHEQLWIAGGIGITPFLSWIRAFPESLAFIIDLYYTVPTADQALYADEIAEAARQHPSFHPHIIYSQRDGRLTVAQIAATSTGEVASKEVYLCGPTGMTERFRHALHQLGVPLERIHFEHFNFR